MEKEQKEKQTKNKCRKSNRFFKCKNLNLKKKKKKKRKENPTEPQKAHHRDRSI